MSEVVTERLSQVESKPIRWIWKPFLARGKLSLLDGDPGVGKSLLALDLAARLSRGDTLPDGQKPERKHITAFLAAEDDVADTIRPRAEAAGAILDFLTIVAGKDNVPLTLPKDLFQISRHVGAEQADLLIIDPIVAFLPPSVAVSSDQCAREALSRLAKFAKSFDCAVLMIRHLRKAASANALYRGSGSMGFIASARTGLIAARNPADPSQCVLAVTKSNLGEQPPALGYRIATSPSGLAMVEWTGPVNVSANELGSAPPPLLARDRASMWLLEQLANGPRPAAELYAAAASAGIPERTLRRAVRAVGVKSERVLKDGGHREWLWMIAPREPLALTAGEVGVEVAMSDFDSE